MNEDRPLANLRIYASVRTAHLERLEHLVPADMIYHGTRYDFDASVVGRAPLPRRVGRFATIVYLLRHRHAVVEINEPFMVNRWFDLLLQIAAARLRARVDGREVKITTYALSLKNPVRDLAQRWFVPSQLAPRIARLVLTALVGQIDRLAFGTEAAYEQMARFVSSDLVTARSRVIPALPAVCDCASPAQLEQHRPPTVIFVGAFATRKGIPQLLEAWDLVVEGCPDARLHLIGTGPLTDRVLAWADSRSGVTVSIDPPRAEIHAALGSARVLVMLSQRQGIWREQVGLPLVEALSHGTRVVTTDESGLASWLVEHGHVVVHREASASRCAAAIMAAISSGPQPGDVLASLPAVDGRVAADRWMFTGSLADDGVFRDGDRDKEES